MESVTDNRGGARKGAGRPKGSTSAELTQMVRVPVGCLDDVRRLIDNYKALKKRDS